MIRSLIVIVCLFLGQLNPGLKAQSPVEIDALNYYIEFINSSSHGLGIAMLIAENMNCQVLESHGMSCTDAIPITVEDIPSNLFDKADDNSGFYSISPLELNKIALKESVVLKSDLSSVLNEKLNRCSEILNQVNSQLYATDEMMKSLKLKKKKHAERVLKALQEIENKFSEFKKLKKEIIDLVIIDYPHPDSKIYPVLYQFRNAAVALLEGLENQSLTENDQSIENYKLVRSNVLETFNTIKAAIGKPYPAYEEQINAFENKSEMFLELIKGSMIKKEELGSKSLVKKCNQISKLTINQTGPGYTVIFKEILRFLSFKAINFDEQIVQYKVEYPQW